MDMKKTYNVPETIVYRVNVTSHLMEPSFEIKPGEDPIGDDDFEQSREENIDESNNRGSVWENLW